MPDHLRVGEFSSRNILFAAAKPSPSHEQPREASQSCPRQELKLRLSLTQMTTRRWDTELDLQAARYLGLKHVGLWRLKYEDYGPDRTADLLFKLGLTPSSLSWVGGFTGVNGYLLEDSLLEAEEVIQYASWVGAANVIVATGEQGRHILSHATRLTVQSLQYLGDIAGEKGVQLAVMPMSPNSSHGWTFLNSLHRAQELIDRCDHPQVGLCLNSYHILQNRHWKSEVSSLIPQIKIMRLCDGLSARRPRTQCLPLLGKMPLIALLDHLESAGYRGMYEIDTWNDDIWQTKDLAPFRTCLDQLTSQFPYRTA